GAGRPARRRSDARGTRCQARPRDRTDHFAGQGQNRRKGGARMTMIIDCHGHYTTAPEPHNQWREDQKAAFKAGQPTPAYPNISDDEIRETIEKNQLRLIKERGADMTIFSPRAS